MLKGRLPAASGCRTRRCSRGHHKTLHHLRRHRHRCRQATTSDPSLAHRRPSLARFALVHFVSSFGPSAGCGRCRRSSSRRIRHVSCRRDANITDTHNRMPATPSTAGGVVPPPSHCRAVPYQPSQLRHAPPRHRRCPHRRNRPPLSSHSSRPAAFLCRHHRCLPHDSLTSMTRYPGLCVSSRASPAVCSPAHLWALAELPADRLARYRASDPTHPPHTLVVRPRPPFPLPASVV